ncbi:unnamed protein product [Chrysoparadoxa australica]
MIGGMRAMRAVPSVMRRASVQLNRLCAQNTAAVSRPGVAAPLALPVYARAMSSRAEYLENRSNQLASASLSEVHDSQDGYFESCRVPAGENTREHAYFVLGGARFLYANGVRFAVCHFIMTLSADESVLALASAEFPIDHMSVGQTITVKWRGKPIFIRRRSDEEVAIETAVHMDDLRDQEPDEERCLEPDWVVVLGICTHLGCVPISNAGEWNGWFCPCHGSHYDVSGRIRKGPAPLNLEVFHDYTPNTIHDLIERTSAINASIIVARHITWVADTSSTNHLLLPLDAA